MPHLLKFSRAFRAMLFAVLICYPLPAAAETVLENAFASMKLDGKKIGQIHFTLKQAPDGQIEELTTNASVSVLGFNVYKFVQHLHETWKDGLMQTLHSDTDDNGTEEKVRVARIGDDFDATRNGKTVKLPTTVFPDSIWHYQITKQKLLFNSVDLKVMKVSVKRSEEEIDHNGKKVKAERFDFSGDWNATLWFNEKKRLLEAHRQIEGHKIVIHVDSDS